MPPLILEPNMFQKLRPIPNIDDLVLKVERPTRYIGNELNAVVKNPAEMRVLFGLAFPDVYEVGMSNVGFRTLYHALNARPDTACERFLMPWPDFEALMKSEDIPLFSLENRLPARDFDVLGFTMQFELCYPTVLAMLDLAGIPLLSADRRRDDPIILGGGPCSYNPEPVADFFDAIVVGEGEEVVHEISDVIAEWKLSNESRDDLLWRLAELRGVYIPALFKVHYNAFDKTISAYEPLKPGYEKVIRRVIPDLNAVPMPEKPVMPFMETIHDRLPIEIQRGCTRGCRFCQVGMITRPTRQRSPENVRELAERGLAATGYDEVGFLSLSSGDYDCINPLLEDFFDRFAPERVAISLPSLRTETMNEKLAEQIGRVRKSGFTVAPEAASERLRRVINKGNKEENLLEAVDSIFKSGWSLVKFYFMIGLPTEQDEDIEAIVDLTAKSLRMAKKHNRHAAINVGVSTFVPKPFTPFQWEPMITHEETLRKHEVLRAALRGLGRGHSNLKVRPHDSRQSSIEGALALGDRRLGTAILRAFQNGQRLDGWTEHFNLDAWLDGFAQMEKKHGVGLAWFAHRGRGEHERLPWDIIDSEVNRPFLWKERQQAYEEADLVDCVIERCTTCGACDYYVVDTRVYKQDDYRKAAPLPPAPPPPKTRSTARLHYALTGPVRALSHLETVRAIERAIRRARLPVVYSQGYSPRPRFTFSPALPVGMESQAEYVDIHLHGEHKAADLKQALTAVFPPGFEVIDIQINPENSLNKGTSTTTYLAALPPISPAQIEAALTQFHLAPTWPFTRNHRGRTREFDLKQQIQSLHLHPEGSLQIEIKSTQSGSARPDELVKSLLGVEPMRVVKKSVSLGVV